MDDIGEVLYERLMKAFAAACATDPQVKNFRKKLEEEKATPEECSKYARNLGACASRAIKKTIKESELPSGKLYWNIAQKTITPLLKEVHKLVNDAACEVQKTEDKREKIGLNPIRTDFPEERVNALIQKAVDMSMKED